MSDVEHGEAERPEEARAPLGPLGLVGSAATGAAMGVVELVPGFSGGTVALVAGFYERLVGNIRQGARVLSLLLRGRLADAGHAFVAIEWPFVVTLFAALGIAVFAVADPLGRLLIDHPVEMSAIFLGLVVGAALLALRLFRALAPVHALVAVATGTVAWLAMGIRPGVIDDPPLLLLGAGAAVAVCAWILPGVSGAFLLLVMGLYQPFVEAIGDRDAAALAVIAVGLVAGVAAFSTLLNWLLVRAHDIVLAVAVGLMLGSMRILWPWPSDAGVGGSAEVAPPPAAEGGTALPLGAIALVLVCAFGLLPSLLLRRARRAGALRGQDAA